MANRICQVHFVLATTISSSGLCGLVAFRAQQLRKEFGVRRAVGASTTQIITTQIMWLFSKDLAGLVPGGPSQSPFRLPTWLSTGGLTRLPNESTSDLAFSYWREAGLSVRPSRLCGPIVGNHFQITTQLRCVTRVSSARRCGTNAFGRALHGGQCSERRAMVIKGVIMRLAPGEIDQSQILRPS